MKIAYEWLQELIPDLNIAPHELADRLTLAGLEVESVDAPSAHWKNIVLGKVAALEAHPKADRLRVAKVDVGKGAPLQIVCGAPNVAEGQLVPVALEGASLPGGLEIRPTQLRGVDSFGMICSEKELGTSDDASGIWVLNERAGGAKPGTPLAQVVNAPAVLDVSVTPNRGDCLSAVGLAREVGALLGLKWKEPGFKLSESAEPVSKAAAVEVEAAELCPRYCARVIEGVKVAPSPKWLTDLLEAHGIRSINNIVDITNYILLLHGQPLHAFDLDEVADAKIIVRAAKAKEKIQTLDEIERELSQGMLVIADPKGAVAVAGVMGGARSQVTEKTTRILLESAYFQPGQVRRTSRALGLISESSYRFERGVDPRRVPVAMNHAAALMAELGGGKARKGFIDATASKFEPVEIALRPARVKGLLGLDVPQKKIEKHLQDLGFEVSGRGEALNVRVPTHRSDVSLEADLIEEVARLEGYDKIPATLPAARGILASDDEPTALRARLQDVLAARGYHQCVNLSFIEAGWPDRAGLSGDDPRRKAVALENPINDEQGVLRTAVLPGLLATYARNRNRGVREVRLFELARIFFDEGKELPHEPLQLALVSGAVDEPTLWRTSDPARTSLFDLKADLEALAHVLDVMLDLGGVCDEPMLHPGRRATISLNGKAIGFWGEIAPGCQQEWGLRERVVLAEFDAGALLAAAVASRPSYSAIGKFPAVWRDLALLVDDKVPAAALAAEARSAGAPLVQSVEVFDEFRGKGIEPGKRSLGLRVAYSSPERTLTEEEAAEAERRVLDALAGRLGASLRA